MKSIASVLLGLTVIAGLAPVQAIAAIKNNCPQLGRVSGSIRHSKLKYKLYILDIKGLEDPTISKRARARFAADLLAEWKQKDGFYSDFTQDGCRSISMSFPEKREYKITSSTSSKIYFKGLDPKLNEGGMLQVATSNAGNSGTVLFATRFNHKFVDECGDGTVIRPISGRAELLWGHDLVKGAEKANNKTMTMLRRYAAQGGADMDCAKNVNTHDPKHMDNQEADKSQFQKHHDAEGGSQKSIDQ